MSPASLRKHEVAALVRIQSLTASSGMRRGAVILSHVGEHALAWTALGLLGAALDPEQRRPCLRAPATVGGAGSFPVVDQAFRMASDPKAVALNRSAKVN